MTAPSVRPPALFKGPMRAYEIEAVVINGTVPVPHELEGLRVRVIILDVGPADASATASACPGRSAAPLEPPLAAPRP